MADLFGGLNGLGGLMKGLTNLMPQNDPATQLFKLQTDVADLKKQETDLYTEIGKRAVEQYGLDSFGDISGRMRLIQANLSDAQTKLNEAQAAKEAQDTADKEALNKRTCPQCGYANPEGTKFCQECGSKLGAQKCFCTSCGAENPSGTRFCGSCGTKILEG